MGSHHLSKNLSEQGHEVVYISVPVTPFHVLKSNFLVRFRLSGKISVLNKNLRQYIPRLLLPIGELIVGKIDISLSLFAGLFLKKTIVSLGINGPYDVVFIDHPKLYEILNYISYKKLVYRPTDIMSGVGIRNNEHYEKKILERCVALIATSKIIVDKVVNLYDFKKPFLIQINGVDYGLFRAPAEKPSIYNLDDRLKVIYVGEFDGRFDFEIARQIVLKFSNLNFYFVGPTNKNLEAYLGEIENVNILGSRRFEEIPPFLQYADIAIMPFSKHPSNAGRSPMKLYEYLSVGLPVVSALTPELERRKLPGVLFYTDFDGACKAISQAISLGKSAHYEPSLDWGFIAKRVIDFVGTIE